MATLEYVFDVKAWISPCLEEIHHHTLPHVFLFKRDKSGHAVMFSKQWAKDSWEPKAGQRLLKVTINCHHKHAVTIFVSSAKVCLHCRTHSTSRAHPGS